MLIRVQLHIRVRRSVCVCVCEQYVYYVIVFLKNALQLLGNSKRSPCLQEKDGLYRWHWHTTKHPGILTNASVPCRPGRRVAIDRPWSKLESRRNAGSPRPVLHGGLRPAPWTGNFASTTSVGVAVTTVTRSRPPRSTPPQGDDGKEVKRDTYHTSRASVTRAPSAPSSVPHRPRRPRAAAALVYTPRCTRPFYHSSSVERVLLPLRHATGHGTGAHHLTARASTPTTTSPPPQQGPGQQQQQPPSRLVSLPRN